MLPWAQNRFVAFVTLQSRNANTVNVQDKIDFSSKVCGSLNEQTSVARTDSDIIRWRRAPAGRTCLNCCAWSKTAGDGNHE